MKIHFANPYEHYDLIACFIADTDIESPMDYFLFTPFPYAIIEKGEEEKALREGWWPVYYDIKSMKGTQVWMQARQARIKTKDFTPKRTAKKIQNKYKNEISWEVVRTNDLSEEQKNKTWSVFLKYIRHKQFIDCGEEDIVETLHAYENFFKSYVLKNVDNRKMIIYHHKGKMIAFSAFQEYEASFFGIQFAWDYENPQMGLGISNIANTVELAKKQNKDYLYTGMSYGADCSYKSDFRGFEYWNGSEWSKDKNKFKKFCEADEEISTMEEFGKLVGIDMHNKRFE